MSDSLWSRGLQHARLLCPSLSPRVCSNWCPLSQWCHPTISSSVTPFSTCPQFFPASGSFPMSQLFTSGGQGIGASASASILPMNTRDWFPLELSGWISLQSKGLSRVFSGTTVQKHQFFSTQLSSYMTTGKTIALNMWTFVGKVMWTFKAWLIASLSYVSHFATTRPWSMLHDPWFMIHEGDYNS